MIYDVEVQAGKRGNVLYVPIGAGKRSAILTLHGSEGGWSGWSHRQALRFAMIGFVSFAPNDSIGGNMWHAGNILDVDLDQLIDVTGWLRDHTATNGKIGLHGVSRGAEMALLATSLMARGVRAGANTLYHAITSYPGTPDSATVGISGAISARFALLTASARSLPLRACGRMPVITLKVPCTSPPITAVTAGLPPLYGTCSRSIWVM